MRTTSAKHRRPDRQRREIWQRNRHRRYQSQITLYALFDNFHRQLTRIRHVSCQLSFDRHVQMVFPTQIGQFPFNYRVQFFQNQHFFQSIQKRKSQCFRKRVRCTYFQKSGFFFQQLKGFFRICIADATSGNSFFTGTFQPV